MIIDRIEKEYAVCENDGQMFHIPLCELPEGVSEGDALSFAGGKYVPDASTTQARREKSQNLLKKLSK